MQLRPLQQTLLPAYAQSEFCIACRIPPRRVIASDYLGQDVRLTLLQLLEDRYGKKSIIVTSQLPVSKWHAYINDPTFADAVLDRLTANAQRIELKGESLRRKKVKPNQ